MDRGGFEFLEGEKGGGKGRIKHGPPLKGKRARGSRRYLRQKRAIVVEK